MEQFAGHFPCWPYKRRWLSATMLLTASVTI